MNPVCIGGRVHRTSETKPLLARSCPGMGDDHGVDWFGNPAEPDGGRPRAPVPCPRCGAGFTDAPSLRAHLAEAHQVAGPVRRRSDASPLLRWWHGLRFLPLWFVLPLNVLFVGLVWLSVTDPLWSPLASLVVRFALLPSILLLAARIASTKP